jgi:hypothetical protein
LAPELSLSNSKSFLWCHERRQDLKVCPQENAAALAGFDIREAKIVSKDGREVSANLPRTKLAAGHDYKIRFQNGRAFWVHIPEGLNISKPAPVMVLVPGVTNNWLGSKPDGYISEAHLNEVDDAASQKSIIITALTEQPTGGRGWIWNMPGALIHPETVAKQARKDGYDERLYFAALFAAVPAITNGTKDHKYWGFLGGSQGAAVLTRLAGERRFAGLLPNLYLAGGSIEVGGKDEDRGKDYHPAPYKFAPGNALNVTIIDTMGDTMILPHKEHAQFPFTGFFQEALGGLSQHAFGLGDVDARHQDPAAQIKLYRDHLASLTPGGKVTLQIFKAPNNSARFKDASFFTRGLDPTQAAAELQHHVDLRIIYRPKSDPEGQRASLTVYELPDAGHLIPGPREGSTSMFFLSKYEGFFAAKAAYDDFNSRVKRYPVGHQK